MGLNSSREALRSAVKAKSACIGMIKFEAADAISGEKGLNGFIVNLKNQGARTEGVKLEAIIDKLLGGIIDVRLKR
jgi:hypothetical protein